MGSSRTSIANADEINGLVFFWTSVATIVVMFIGAVYAWSGSVADRIPRSRQS
jgi:hypothetical protein